jgi:uncharacterized protein HemX
MNKIAIGTALSIITAAAGAGVWYDGTQQAEHEAIETELDQEIHAGGVELSLQQVELELKLLRAIQERRALTADELDRKAYLEAYRLILVAEQKKQV